MLLFHVFAGVIIFFLVLPFAVVLFGSLLKDPIDRRRKNATRPTNFDFANIITAYRNADIAEPLVRSLLNQTEAKQHIYLIADNADLKNWTLTHDNLTILKPELALNLKIKSVIYATERFVRPHNYTIIWDADNLAHPHFLEVINHFANAGYVAIQGQRTAKNVDTRIAAADALGEYYKNFIERLLPPRLGSSSVISGSGMAVRTDIYNGYLYSKDIQEGQKKYKKMMQEDKILQNYLLNAGCKIMFAEDAICFDEKITSAQAVETQRSRWLFSYFQNIPNALGFIFKGIITLNWNKFLFGLLTFSPPLFILIGLAGFTFLIGLFFDVNVAIAVITAGIIFVVNIFLSLIVSGAPKTVFESLTAIPQFIWRQFLGLFKMVNPEKNFKPTENKKNLSVDDVLKSGTNQ